jgi:transposase
MCPMSTKNNGKRYNDDFKSMVVDLYHSGSSVKDLSSEYGVSNVTIYQWIKDLTPIEGTSDKEITPKDVDAIQKENLRLKQELEILKKAMAIFAQK